MTVKTWRMNKRLGVALGAGVFLLVSGALEDGLVNSVRSYTPPVSADELEARATPGPSPCATTLDLRTIVADQQNRVASTDLDATARKRTVLTPDDPRTFLAQVSKTQLASAHVGYSTTWSDDLILVVNHGSWESDQTHKPLRAVPVPTDDGTPSPDPDKVFVAWRLFVYDRGEQDVARSTEAADGPCFLT
jgi:hypothetical protein